MYIPFKGAVYGLFDSNLDGTESSQEGLHYDRNGDGFLSDDERDEDADGLSNYDENNGRTQPGWWSSCYSGEAAYYVHYAGTDLTDADTDGDGVRDGADDQDHDDLPNVMELSRIAASGIDDREPGGTGGGGAGQRVAHVDPLDQVAREVHHADFSWSDARRARWPGQDWGTTSR